MQGSKVTVYLPFVDRKILFGIVDTVTPLRWIVGWGEDIQKCNCFPGDGHKQLSFPYIITIPSFPFIHIPISSFLYPHSHTYIIIPIPIPSSIHLYPHSHTYIIIPIPIPSFPYLYHHSHSYTLIHTPISSFPYLYPHSHTYILIPILNSLLCFYFV